MTFALFSASCNEQQNTDKKKSEYTDRPVSNQYSPSHSNYYPEQSIHWKKLLLKPDINTEDFEKAYLIAIQERYPNAVITRREEFSYLIQIEGDEVQLLIHNAWNETFNKPQLRLYHCEAIRNSIEAGLHKDDLNPIRIESVVPVIKDKTFIDYVLKNSGNNTALYHEHLVADLYVVYAEDTNDSIIYLTQKDVKKFKQSKKMIRALALDNLQQKIEGIKLHEGDNVNILSAGNNFESSLILLDELWSDLSQEVQGEIIMAIPSRNTIAFTGSQSEYGMNKLRTIIDKEFKQGAYLVTDHIFIRKEGKWQKIE